jgi:Cu-Zn family superoxide dismutase
MGALVATPATAEVLGIGKSSASALIIDASGLPIGKATIKNSKKRGLQLSVRVRNLQPGERGIHIHAIGRCEGPKFVSAGPHWNPMGRQHGLDNPSGSHHGDLPNLLVNRKGRGVLKHDLTQGQFRGAGGLLDDDGAAIVIHAASDDQRTDPTGNSGDRVACGVFLKD